MVHDCQRSVMIVYGDDCGCCGKQELKHWILLVQISIQPIMAGSDAYSCQISIKNDHLASKSLATMLTTIAGDVPWEKPWLRTKVDHPSTRKGDHQKC